MTDDIREAARQAAREAVAASPAWSFYSTDEILAGKADRSPALWAALLGADAALAAVAPLIRAQCAEVAEGERRRLLDAADEGWNLPGANHALRQSLRHDRESQAATAAAIRNAIIALNEKETT